MEGNKHLFDCSHNFFPPEQETLQNSSETSHPTFEDFTYTSAVFSIGKRQEWQFLYELSLCKDGIPKKCIAPNAYLVFFSPKFFLPSVFVYFLVVGAKLVVFVASSSLAIGINW